MSRDGKFRLVINEDKPLAEETYVLDIYATNAYYHPRGLLTQAALDRIEAQLGEEELEKIIYFVDAEMIRAQDYANKVGKMGFRPNFVITAGTLLPDLEKYKHLLFDKAGDPSRAPIAYEAIDAGLEEAEQRRIEAEKYEAQTREMKLEADRIIKEGKKDVKPEVKEMLKEELGKWENFKKVFTKDNPSETSMKEAYLTLARVKSADEAIDVISKCDLKITERIINDVHRSSVVFPQVQMQLLRSVVPRDIPNISYIRDAFAKLEEVSEKCKLVAEIMSTMDENEYSKFMSIIRMSEFVIFGREAIKHIGMNQNILHVTPMNTKEEGRVYYVYGIVAGASSAANLNHAFAKIGMRFTTNEQMVLMGIDGMPMVFSGESNGTSLLIGNLLREYVVKYFAPKLERVEDIKKQLMLIADEPLINIAHMLNCGTELTDGVLTGIRFNINGNTQGILNSYYPTWLQDLPTKEYQFIPTNIALQCQGQPQSVILQNMVLYDEKFNKMIKKIHSSVPIQVKKNGEQVNKIIRDEFNGIHVNLSEPLDIDEVKSNLLALNHDVMNGFYRMLSGEPSAHQKFTNMFTIFPGYVTNLRANLFVALRPIFSNFNIARRVMMSIPPSIYMFHRYNSSMATLKIHLQTNESPMYKKSQNDHLAAVAKAMSQSGATMMNTFIPEDSMDFIIFAPVPLVCIKKEDAKTGTMGVYQPNTSEAVMKLKGFVENIVSLKERPKFITLLSYVTFDENVYPTLLKYYDIIPFGVPPAPDMFYSCVWVNLVRKDVVLTKKPFEVMKDEKKKLAFIYTVLYRKVYNLCELARLLKDDLFYDYNDLFKTKVANYQNMLKTIIGGGYTNDDALKFAKERLGVEMDDIDWDDLNDININSKVANEHKAKMPELKKFSRMDLSEDIEGSQKWNMFDN